MEATGKLSLLAALVAAATLSFTPAAFAKGKPPPKDTSTDTSSTCWSCKDTEVTVTTVNGTADGEAFTLNILTQALSGVDLGDLPENDLLSSILTTATIGPVPYVAVNLSGGSEGFDMETVANVKIGNLVSSLTMANEVSGAVTQYISHMQGSSLTEDLRLIKNSLGEPLISAKALWADCNSTVSPSGVVEDGTNGGSGFAELVIAGQAFTTADLEQAVTAQSPTLLNPLGVTVTFNKYERSGARITQTALSVEIVEHEVLYQLGLPIGLSSEPLLTTTIDIARAQCDAASNNSSETIIERKCTDTGNPLPPPEPESPKPFITGGGIIEGASDGFATFGFNARDGKGQVQYVDHKAQVRIHGNTVTRFELIPDTTCVHFGGDTKDGGQYDAIACDIAEPGRRDSFGIEWRHDGMTYNNGYYLDNPDIAKQLLDKGGNIQLH